MNDTKNPVKVDTYLELSHRVQRVAERLKFEPGDDTLAYRNQLDYIVKHVKRLEDYYLREVSKNESQGHLLPRDQRHDPAGAGQAL